MSEITRFKTGGAWKQVNNVYYKLSGAWKDVTFIRHKINGTTWKVVFSSSAGVPNITVTTLTDDYPAGSAISGTYANYHGLYYYNDNVSLYDIFKAAGYAVGAWTSANEAPWGNLTFNVDTYMVGSNNTLPTIYCGDDNTHGSWFFPIGGSSNGINVASGRFYLEIGKDGNIATYNGGLKLAFVDEIGWTLPHVSGKPYNGTSDLLNTTDPQNLTEVWEEVDEYKWLYGTQNIDLIDPRYNDKRILTNLYVNASGSSSTVGYYSITLYEGSYYIKYETEPNGYSNTDVLGISNYTSGATLTGWTADSSTLPGGSTGTASVTVPVNTTFNGVQKGGRLYRETFEISVLHPTHIASGTYTPTGDTYAELVTKKTNTTLTINIKRGGWVMGAPGDRGQSAATGFQGPADNSTDDNGYHSDNTYNDWIEDYQYGNNQYGSADTYWPQTRGGTVKYEFFVTSNDHYNRGRGYRSQYSQYYSPADSSGFAPSAALSASIWGINSFQHYTIWDSRATYYNGKDGKKGATAINANLTDIDIDVNVEAEGILFGGLGGVGEGGHGPAIEAPGIWSAYFTNTSTQWTNHTEAGYVDYRQQTSYYSNFFWGRPQYESIDSYSNLQSSGGTARGPQPRPLSGPNTYRRLYRPSFSYNYSGTGTSGTGGNQLTNFTDALTVESGTKYQDKDDRAVYTSTTNNGILPLWVSNSDGAVQNMYLRNSSLGPHLNTSNYSTYNISFNTSMYSGFTSYSRWVNSSYHNLWQQMANGGTYVNFQYEEGPLDWERNSTSHSYTTFTYYVYISTKWGSFNQQRTGYSYKYGFRYKSSNNINLNSSPGGYVGNLNTVSSETVSNAPYIASGQSSAPSSGSAQGAHSLASYTNPTRTSGSVSSIDPFGGETKSWILEYDFLCAGNPTYGDNPTLVKRGFKSIEYPMSYCAAPGDSTTKFEGTIGSTIKTEDIYFGVRHVMSGFGGRMGPIGYFLEGIDNSNVTLTATAGTASASAGCKVDGFGDTIMIMGFQSPSGGVIFQSTDDGDTWTSAVAANSLTNNSVASIAYKPPSGRDEGIYVAGVLNSNGEVLVSTDDGKTWINFDPYSGVSSIRSIAYGNGTFIAVGDNGQDFITSPDGLVWTQHEYTGTVYNTPSQMWGVAYGTPSGSDLYVAVGTTGCIMYSSDAITWTQLSNAYGGTYSTNRGVAYGNGTFVAVNSHGTIYTSTNGTLWFSRTNVYSQATYPMSGTNYGMYGVAYGATGGDGTWVVVGDWGVIQTSTDNGVTWTHRSSGYDSWNSGNPSGPNSNVLWDVTYTSNGTFVVVGAGSNSAGGNGKIIISTDNGVTWTSKASPMSASGSIFYGVGNSNQGQSTNEAYGPSYIIGSRKDSATKKGFDDVRFRKIVNSDFWSNDTAIKPEKYPGEVNNFPGNFHVSGNDYGWNPNLNSGNGDYVIKWSGSTEVVIPQYDNRIFSLAEDDSSKMIKVQTRYSLQYRPLRNLTRKYYDHSSAFTNAEMSTNVSNLPNNTFVAHGRDGRFGAHRAFANEFNSNTSTFDLQKYIERFFCLSSGSIVVDNRGGGTNYSFFNPYGNKANILQWMINDGKGHYPFGSSHADKATEILGWRAAYPQDFDRYLAYLKYALRVFKFDMNSTVITGSDNAGDYSTFYESDYYYGGSSTNYRYDYAANVAAANTFERWLEYMFPTQTAAADSSTSLVSHGSAGIACVLAVNTQTTQAVQYYSENYASSHMNVGNTFVRNNGLATTYGKDACVPVMYIFKRSHLASSTSSDDFDYYREIANVCGNPTQYGLSTFGTNQYAGIWRPQQARESTGLLNIINDGDYDGSDIRDAVNSDYDSKFFPASNQCKYLIAIVPSPHVTAKVLFSSAHFFGQSGQRNIISNANDSEANVTAEPNTRKNPRAPHVPGNSEHYTESINLGYRYRYGDTADTGNSNTLKESSYTGYFKQQSNSTTNNDIIYDNSELRGQEGYAFRLYSGQNQTVSYVDDFYGKHGHQANNITGGNAHFNPNIDFICSAGSLVCVQDYEATNIYATTNGGFMGPDYSETTNYNNTNLLFNKYGTRYKILRDFTTLRFEMHRMNWSSDWCSLELYFYDTPFGYGGIDATTGEASVQGKGIPNYSGTPGDIANTATGAPVGYWKGFLFRLFVRLYSQTSGWPGYNRVIVDTGGYADSTGGTVITNLSNYGTGSGANQYGAYYHNVTFSTGNLVSTQYSSQGVANFTSDFINNSITLPPVMWVEPASGWKYTNSSNASYATQHGGCAARGTYSGSGRAEVAMKLIHS